MSRLLGFAYWATVSACIAYMTYEAFIEPLK